jgi:hypothetical protein
MNKKVSTTEYFYKTYKRTYCLQQQNGDNSGFIKHPEDNIEDIINGHRLREFKGITRRDFYDDGNILARVWIIRPEFPLQNTGDTDKREYECKIRINYKREGMFEYHRMDEILRSKGFD